MTLDSSKVNERSRHTPLKKMSFTSKRFVTGIVLGLILVITLGSFVPLLAYPHDPIHQEVIAQLLADSPTPETVIPESEAEEADEVPLSLPMPTDIDEHWAKDCIMGLARRGAIPLNDQESYPPNSPVEDAAKFYPNDAATWSSATLMLNDSFPTGLVYGGATDVETALELPSPINVLYNYPPDAYDPDQDITRVEAINALAAKLEVPYVARANELVALSFQDGNRVPAWGREGIASALVAGVLVNHPDAQRVEGNRVITRGEVAALVCRASDDPSLRTTISPGWVPTPVELPTQTQPDAEVRGVWLTNIDSDVLFSRENLIDGIQRLKAMNINTLYPVVWNMGYTQFPSRTAAYWLGRKQRLWPGENPSFEQAQSDRDMLQELIEIAHTEGMTVIPWFEFGFMAPADYELRTQHPEWFTQRQDGSQEIPMGEEVFTWMNPFHPQTRRLLLLLIAEVLENYDIAGIQVDDHLGLPIDMGYDPYTVALYELEHDGQSPPSDDTDPEWMRWRANKITEFMEDVRRVIDERQPGALLSVSPNPYPFSYAKYLQDWPQWEAAGLLDEIIVQVYRNDLDRFAWELNKPATVNANRNTLTSIGILSGLRGRPTDVDLLTEQLKAVRDRNYGGVSYFFYQSLWDPGRETVEERINQFQTAFSKAAQRP